MYSSAQWRSSTLTPLKNACLIWATWWCLLFGIMWPRPLLSKLFACDVVVKVWAIQSRYLWVKAFSRNMQNPKCKWWNVFAEDMGQVRVSCLTSPFGISDTDLAVSPPIPTAERYTNSQCSIKGGPQLLTALCGRPPRASKSWVAACMCFRAISPRSWLHFNCGKSSARESVSLSLLL